MVGLQNRPSPPPSRSSSPPPPPPPRSKPPLRLPLLDTSLLPLLPSFSCEAAAALLDAVSPGAAALRPLPLREGVQGAWAARAGSRQMRKLQPQDATWEAFAPYGKLVGPTEEGAPSGQGDALLDVGGGVPRFRIERVKQQALRFGALSHHARVALCLGAVGGGPWLLAVAPPTLLGSNDGFGESLVGTPTSSASSALPSPLSDQKGAPVGEATSPISVVASPYGESPISVSPSSTGSSAGDEAGELCGERGGKHMRSRNGHLYGAPRAEDVAVFRIKGPCFVKLHPGTWHSGPLLTVPEMDFFKLELADTNQSDCTMYSFTRREGLVFDIDVPLASSGHHLSFKRHVPFRDTAHLRLSLSPESPTSTLEISP